MADVVRRFGPSYRASAGLRLTWAHQKALKAIENCRTSALGGHVLECNDCKVREYVYHSCRHRSCPKCMQGDAHAWVEARLAEVLPVPHFHVVFNFPAEIVQLLRRHRRALYPVAMRAAALALLDVGADPAYLGGEVGVLTTLHTWSRTLVYHPHVHCLVTAGFMDSHGRWRSAAKKRLAPEEVLADRFRTHFLGLIPLVLDLAEVPSSAPLSSWSVFAELARTGNEAVLRYFAKTLYSGPFSEHQIDTISDAGVGFHYYDRNESRRRQMKLGGTEFLRRFLQHVWPRRIHRVQYHGLWSRKSRPEMQALRSKLERHLLPTEPSVADPQSLTASATTLTAVVATPTPRWLRCPHCAAVRTVLGRLSRNGQVLPLMRQALHPPTPECARPP